MRRLLKWFDAVADWMFPASDQYIIKYKFDPIAAAQLDMQQQRIRELERNLASIKAERYFDAITRPPITDLMTPSRN